MEAIERNTSAMKRLNEAGFLLVEMSLENVIDFYVANAINPNLIVVESWRTADHVSLLLSETPAQAGEDK